MGMSLYDESAALRHFGRPLGTGEIGCFASHYLVWQRCLQAREPFLIMEDDVLLEYGFIRALTTASALIGRFPLLRIAVSLEGPNSVPILSLSSGFEVVSLGSGSFGAQCYTLSQVGAKALVEQAGVWTLPVDIYFDRPDIHGLGNFALRPYFVKQLDPTAYPSTIGDERYGLWPPETIQLTPFAQAPQVPPLETWVTPCIRSWSTK